MGKPNFPIYGNADAGSAVEDIEKVVAKIKTNEFSKKDLIKLAIASNELLVSVLNNDYEE